MIMKENDVIVEKRNNIRTLQRVFGGTKF